MSGTIDYKLPFWARVALAWRIVRNKPVPMPGAPPANVSYPDKREDML